MAEDSIFDELDESSAEPSIGQDFEDWWVPDEMGAHLMGVIVEVHSAPEQFTEAGEEPDPIYTILSVGRGDFDAGEAFCTKTHVQILSGLRTAEIGDLVNLRHQGLQRTEGGNAANTYEIGVIPEAQWEESDQADEIQELIDGYGGATGDNQLGEPYEAAGGSGTSPSSSSGGSGLSEAGDFLDDLLDMQGGEMDVEQADKMLNDVRELGVEVGEVAGEIGASVDDGTLSR